MEATNKIWWVFTFGVGTDHKGKYVRIYGTYDEARQKMIDNYGTNWAFQYKETEFLEKRATRPIYLQETLLEEIK